MKKILFRGDAAPHIGIGDLMSLINLSFYFKNYESHFLIKNYEAAVKLVNEYELKNVNLIPYDISIEDEISYINNFAKEYEIDVFFFEITERKFSDYQGLVQNVKKVVVNFDGYITNDLDIVIDWDVVAHKYFDTKSYPNTQFLLGAEYVILPKSFYSENVKNRKNTLSNKRVLIALGGADEHDYTSKIVQTIIKSGLDIELNIVIGAGYTKRDALEAMLNQTSIIYEINQNVSNMLEQYLSCDVGIGAGGLTSSELIATKTSAILIALYEHQIERCTYFYEAGWAHYLGFMDFEESALIDALKQPLPPTETSIFNTYKIVESVNDLFK